MAGLTTTGFGQKTLSDIKTELEAALRASFGDSIDLSPQEPFGQLVGVMAERFADLWALGGTIYSMATPDGATGLSLDEVCAITGTVRDPARSSAVVITATGTPTTVLLSGRVATVQTTGTRFVTIADGTIAALTAWVALTAYVAGDRRTNGSKAYVCITSGTSAGSGGPTTTAADITDGTVHWRYMGAGTGAVDIAAESEDTGPKVAASGTLNAIGSPQTGWSSVINLLDATLGADLETDSSLRIRREDELRSSGNAAVEAIRADVLQVIGVTACTVFNNPTDATDADGVPPHSVEVLVQGGDDADIAAALFGTVAAGIGTHGTTTTTVTDSQGIAHTVKFSRPTLVPIWVIVNLTADTSIWPADGGTQVKDRIIAWAALQKTGKNAVAAAIVAQAFGVTGTSDATALIGLANPPVASVTLAIASRELATYDTSRITVNVSFATP